MVKTRGQATNEKVLKHQKKKERSQLSKVFSSLRKSAVKGKKGLRGYAKKEDLEGLLPDAILDRKNAEVVVNNVCNATTAGSARRREYRNKFKKYFRRVCPSGKFKICGYSTKNRDKPTKSHCRDIPTSHRVT